MVLNIHLIFLCLDKIHYNTLLEYFTSTTHLMASFRFLHKLREVQTAFIAAITPN